jgi:hypothetical protein
MVQKHYMMYVNEYGIITSNGGKRQNDNENSK